MRPSGASARPATDQRSPSETAPHDRPHRKERDPRPGVRARARARAGRESTRSPPPIRIVGRAGVAHQRVHRREVVVDAARRESRGRGTAARRRASGTSRGRWCPARRPRGAARRARAAPPGRASEVHVADHRGELPPAGQRYVAAAVRRDRHGGERRARPASSRRDRPARRRPASPARAERYERAGHSQGWIATAEIAFCGEPSISRSE